MEATYGSVEKFGWSSNDCRIALSGDHGFCGLLRVRREGRQGCLMLHQKNLSYVQIYCRLLRCRRQHRRDL